MTSADFSSYKPTAHASNAAAPIDNFMDVLQTLLNGGLDDANIIAGALSPNRLKQGGAAVGQALVWTGSAWAPGSVAVASSRFFPIPLRVDSGWTQSLARTASEAVGAMFFLPATTTISKFYVAVPNVQSGNFDFGIYDFSFNALWRYGSHAVPAVSASVAVEILVSAGTPATTPLVLTPGYYYLVSAIDNVTANMAQISAPSGTTANQKGLSGVAALDALPLWFTKTASFPLPNPIASPTAYTYTGTAPKVLQVEGVA